ncbi:MAG: right-handed parallel beta-helix repeat-containing protein [Candidatus Thorarchaeota archaeon]
MSHGVSIEVAYSSDVVVARNNVSEGTSREIPIFHSSSTTVENNLLTGNEGNEICLSSCIPVTVRWNNITRNLSTGISVHDSHSLQETTQADPQRSLLQRAGQRALWLWS